jgi:hypothetical protein
MLTRREVRMYLRPQQQTIMYAAGDGALARSNGMEQSATQRKMYK